MKQPQFLAGRYVIGFWVMFLKTSLGRLDYLCFRTLSVILSFFLATTHAAGFPQLQPTVQTLPRLGWPKLARIHIPSKSAVTSSVRFGVEVPISNLKLLLHRGTIPRRSIKSKVINKHPYYNPYVLEYCMSSCTTLILMLWGIAKTTNKTTDKTNFGDIFCSMAKHWPSDDSNHKHEQI